MAKVFYKIDITAYKSNVFPYLKRKGSKQVLNVLVNQETMNFLAGYMIAKDIDATECIVTTKGKNDLTKEHEAAANEFIRQQQDRIFIDAVTKEGNNK